MEELTFHLSRLTETRVRVEVLRSGESLGLVYFEKPKLGWRNKPVMPSKWACVDASIVGLFIEDQKGGESLLTPKEVISHMQVLVEEFVGGD